MKFLTTLHRALRRGTAEPVTVAELRQAEVDNDGQARADRVRRESLEVDRGRVLVTGTVEELEAHDREIEMLRRREAQAEARARELVRLRKEAEARERIVVGPSLVAALEPLELRVERALMELGQAREQLTKAARALSDCYYGARRDDTLAQLPVLDEGRLRNIAQLLGWAEFELPRVPPPPPVPDRVIRVGGPEHDAGPGPRGASYGRAVEPAPRTDPTVARVLRNAGRQ